MRSGCICCANGNDLPDGEYCRACGRDFEKLLKAVRDSPALSEQSNAVVVSGKLWSRIASLISHAQRDATK